jgi:hypothetical protein
VDELRRCFIIGLQKVQSPLTARSGGHQHAACRFHVELPAVRIGRHAASMDFGLARHRVGLRRGSPCKSRTIVDSVGDGTIYRSHQWARAPRTLELPAWFRLRAYDRRWKSRKRRVYRSHRQASRYKQFAAHRATSYRGARARALPRRGIALSHARRMASDPDNRTQRPPRCRRTRYCCVLSP